MTDSVIVRNMTMEEFKDIRRPGGGKKSPQREAIEALEAGIVIVIQHTSAGCGRERGATHCTINSIIGFVNRKSQNGLHLWARHLPDGNVAIACVAKDQAP